MKSIKKLAQQKLRTSRNKSLVYLVVLFLFTVGFSAFLTSRLWAGGEHEVIETAHQTPISLRNTGAIYIEEWVYNPDTRKAYLTIQTDGLRAEESLSFVPQERVSPRDMLPHTVVYESRHGLVLEIENLSSEWEVMAVGLVVNRPSYSIMNDEEEDEEATPSNPLDDVEYFLQTDQRVIDINTDIGIKDDHEYAAAFVQFEIEQAERDIETEEQQKQNAQDHRDRLYRTLSELEDDQSYQTAEEIDETQIEIDRLKGEIRAIDDAIYDHDVAIENQQAKIENLEEKREETAQLESTNDE